MLAESPSRIFYSCLLIFIGSTFALNSGCDLSNSPEFRLNRVEILRQERQVLPAGEQFDSQYAEHIELILLALFGTPEEPRFPLQETIVHEKSLDFFRPDHLKMAAGAVSSDREGVPSGLYREHCAQCHGITGDGAGSVAGFLDPYPRDFRLGKFKFKSTPLRQAPTHDDLMELLIDGVPGTAMPSFRNLPTEHLEALVDYVRYLTVRGQFERALINEAGRINGEPLLNLNGIRSEKLTSKKVWQTLDEADFQEIERQALDLVGEDVLAGLIGRWLDAEEKQTLIPDPPASFDERGREYDQLVDLGHTIFLEKGNCLQCHAIVDGKPMSVDNFDDWTNEWIKTSGIDLANKRTYRDFLKAGALPPRTVRPRLLHLSTMRGGDEPHKIFLRIANGIEGTPMPSAPTLTSDEIWALVAYVKSLPQGGSE